MDFQQYTVAGAVLVVGMAFIGFLRDRNHAFRRLDVLEAKSREDGKLLDTVIHSDVDKLLILATAAQTAARLQGKELRIRDLATIYEYRNQRRATEGADGDGKRTA